MFLFHPVNGKTKTSVEMIAHPPGQHPQVGQMINKDRDVVFRTVYVESLNLTSGGAIGVELGDLTGVDLTGVNNGDTIVYNNGTWEPANPVNNLSELLDVDASGVSDGDVLTYTAGGVWEAQPPASVPSALDDLTDVTITTPVDGNLLTYNAGTWTNSVPASTIDTLNDLTDVNINAPETFDTLIYTGSGWTNAPPDPVFSTLDSLTDVIISTATDGDALTYNGSQWVNTPAAAAISLTQGTYQPTGTVESGDIATILGWPSRYIRINDTIYVWCTVTLDLSLSASEQDASFTMDIPVARGSNFSNGIAGNFEVSGTVSSCETFTTGDSLVNGIGIEGVSNTQTVRCKFSFTSTATKEHRFDFSYTYDV